MNEYAVLAPIVLLFALGAFIALRSGADSHSVARAGAPAEAGARVVAGNMTAILLRLLGYVLVLLAMETFVGFPRIFIG
jgi:hypothetical protein